MPSKGIGGHQSAAMKNDEWLTPPDIIKSLGSFDLDPCSPIIRPWDTAAHHYSKEDDGLAKSWFGRVWLNPPYGREVVKWLQRLVNHGNGIACIFARTETQHFFTYGWDRADSIFFMKSRPHFHYVDGRRAAANSGAPVCFMSYGKNNMEAIADSGLPGKHVILKYTPIVVIGISPSWISVVRIAVREVGDEEMAPVYEMVERIAPDKVQANSHWKEKIRQKVQAIRKERA